MTNRRPIPCRSLIVLVATLLTASHSLAQVTPDETLKSFELADGLEATVWATEPMLVNPTNIDIDARGRVWVAEGANYRTWNTRPEGDRIVILEDTDHDGKADSQKVFVQDPALTSPLGVAVIGNKLYVSQSPSILVYTIDESGDKPIGKPEVWMTGFEGINHDHGVHSIVFGPDGRLYFNCGNDGCKSKEPLKLGIGKDVVDSTGSSVPRGPLWRGKEREKGVIGYQEGMAFRCNPDGSGFETLGYNFRNNFELAVDSFGTVWQSDNDDDGNEGVRINYVMEGGNFGYHGPQGHDWGRDQAAFPGQTKQQAHWHQKWPGVVPNLLHTGAGSPTGIVLYEGELLPERFRGAMIHCEPGHNVVRAYIPKSSAQVPIRKFDEADALEGPDRRGAGFKAEVVNIVKGKDYWFRPSDVCVAPDGSLFIADWYDPGVGGHQTRDQGKDDTPDWHKLRGRIYRVAPRGNKSSFPMLDLSTAEGFAAAVKSPNIATRQAADAKLLTTPGVHATLGEMFAPEQDVRYRARALWMLARTSLGRSYVEQALQDPGHNIRITAFRAARLINKDSVIPAALALANDPSAAVRREVAVAMNYQPAEQAVPVLVKLANQFDGEDRWALEAIGIGATGKEKELLAAWEKDGTNKDGKAGDLIRWRLKMEPPAALTLNDRTQVVTKWWVVGPFDVIGKEDELNIEFPPEGTPTAVDAKREFDGANGKPVKWEQVGTTPYDSIFQGLQWVDFQSFCAARGEKTERVVGYFATTIASPLDQSAKLLLGSNDGCRVWVNGKEVLFRKAIRDVRAADDVVPVDLKRGDNVLFVKLHQRTGTSGLLVAVEGEQQKVGISESIPGKPSETVAQSNDSSPAVKIDPNAKGPVAKDGSPLPPLADLVKLPGDAKTGEAVFANSAGANCISCHQIGDKGQMLGPPLNTIGQKLTKAQLYESILTPNAGILMGYENWLVKTKKGDTLSGLKTSETAETITIKDTAGKYHDIVVADIARSAKQTISIMPENLPQTMTKQELIDLVEYLSTLRDK